MTRLSARQERKAREEFARRKASASHLDVTANTSYNDWITNFVVQEAATIASYDSGGYSSDYGSSSTSCDSSSSYSDSSSSYSDGGSSSCSSDGGGF